MRKTLKIDFYEVSQVITSEEKKKIYKSEAASSFVETETDMFFLLDEENYKSFCNYFQFELDENQIEEIYSNFSLEGVLSLQEAAEMWNMDTSTLRKALAGEYKSIEFHISEYRKAGGTWIIKKSAMYRLYGQPKEDL